MITAAERAYLIATVAFALLLIAFGEFVLDTSQIPPGAHFQEEWLVGDVFVFIFFPAAAILIPGLVGLLRRRLTKSGTILQCVFLFPAFILVVPLALGIWGIVLLRRARRPRATPLSPPVAAPATGSGP
jgi:hypothetical protein